VVTKKLSGGGNSTQFAKVLRLGGQGTSADRNQECLQQKKIDLFRKKVVQRFLRNKTRPPKGQEAR